jgi:hypothetical protein
MKSSAASSEIFFASPGFNLIYQCHKPILSVNVIVTDLIGQVT